jgi:hypothetical protein
MEATNCPGPAWKNPCNGVTIVEARREVRAIRLGQILLDIPCEFSVSERRITLLMKRFRHSSERDIRLALISLLLGLIVASGCDSGGNVLTPPEGGSKVDEAKPKQTKLKPGSSTRRDREKENAQ